MRGLLASALSSEFCIVQVLAGPQNLSALRNSISESCKVLCVMQIQSGPEHFVLYNDVSAIALREVPL